MRILVLYGVGTDYQKYRCRFLRKYPYLLDDKVSVTFRSTYRKVDTSCTYDAVYVDIDTISERDKPNLEKYMRHYAHVPRRHISISRKAKLKTYIVNPVKELR